VRSNADCCDSQTRYNADAIPFNWRYTIPISTPTSNNITAVQVGAPGA